MVQVNNRFFLFKVLFVLFLIISIAPASAYYQGGINNGFAGYGGLNYFSDVPFLPVIKKPEINTFMGEPAIFGKGYKVPNNPSLTHNNMTTNFKPPKSNLFNPVNNKNPNTKVKISNQDYSDKNSDITVQSQPSYVQTGLKLISSLSSQDSPKNLDKRDLVDVQVPYNALNNVTLARLDVITPMTDNKIVYKPPKVFSKIYSSSNHPFKGKGLQQADKYTGHGFYRDTHFIRPLFGDDTLFSVGKLDKIFKKASPSLKTIILPFNLEVSDECSLDVIQRALSYLDGLNNFIIAQYNIKIFSGEGREILGDASVWDYLIWCAVHGISIKKEFLFYMSLLWFLDNEDKFLNSSVNDGSYESQISKILPNSNSSTIKGISLYDLKEKFPGNSQEVVSWLNRVHEHNFMTTAPNDVTREQLTWLRTHLQNHYYQGGLPGGVGDIQIKVTVLGQGDLIFNTITEALNDITTRNNQNPGLSYTITLSSSIGNLNPFFINYIDLNEDIIIPSKINIRFVVDTPENTCIMANNVNYNVNYIKSSYIPGYPVIINSISANGTNVNGLNKLKAKTISSNINPSSDPNGGTGSSASTGSNYESVCLSQEPEETSSSMTLKSSNSNNRVSSNTIRIINSDPNHDSIHILEETGSSMTQGLENCYNQLGSGIEYLIQSAIQIIRAIEQETNQGMIAIPLGALRLLLHNINKDIITNQRLLRGTMFPENFINEGLLVQKAHQIITNIDLGQEKPVRRIKDLIVALDLIIDSIEGASGQNGFYSVNIAVKEAKNTFITTLNKYIHGRSDDQLISPVVQVQQLMPNVDKWFSSPDDALFREALIQFLVTKAPELQSTPQLKKLDNADLKYWLGTYYKDQTSADYKLIRLIKAYPKIIWAISFVGGIIIRGMIGNAIKGDKKPRGPGN